jgi:hypothetical protein
MSTNVRGPNPTGPARLFWSAVVMMLAVGMAWSGPQGAPRPSTGKDAFRFDTFGNETFWTDTLRLHEAIATAVDPHHGPLRGPEGGRGRPPGGPPEDR